MPGGKSDTPFTQHRPCRQRSLTSVVSRALVPMPIPLSKRARILTVLGIIAIVAAGFVVFRKWFSKWPPSPEDLLGHKGFSWRTQETANFWIHYEGNSFAEKEVGLLTKMHEVAMPGMLELIGEPTYPQKIHIFAVESRARMKTLSGLRPNGTPLSRAPMPVGSNTK